MDYLHITTLIFQIPIRRCGVKGLSSLFYLAKGSYKLGTLLKMCGFIYEYY